MCSVRVSSTVFRFLQFSLYIFWSSRETPIVPVYSCPSSLFFLLSQRWELSVSFCPWRFSFKFSFLIPSLVLHLLSSPSCQQLWHFFYLLGVFCFFLRLFILLESFCTCIQPLCMPMTCTPSCCSSVSNPTIVLSQPYSSL